MYDKIPETLAMLRDQGMTVASDRSQGVWIDSKHRQAACFRHQQQHQVANGLQEEI